MKHWRSKGIGFEIEIAKLLTEWAKASLNDASLPEKLFWRGVGSGSSLKHNPSVVLFHGDVVPIHPSVYPFGEIVYVECKRWKTIDILSLLDNKKQQDVTVFGKVLLDALNNATNVNKILWFIIKRNHTRDSLLFTPSTCLTCFNLQDKTNTMRLFLKGIEFMIVPFRQFLSVVSYAEFISTYKKQSTNEGGSYDK